MHKSFTRHYTSFPHEAFTSHFTKIVKFLKIFKNRSHKAFTRHSQVTHKAFTRHSRDIRIFGGYLPTFCQQAFTRHSQDIHKAFHIISTRGIHKAFTSHSQDITHHFRTTHSQVIHKTFTNVIFLDYRSNVIAHGTSFIYHLMYAVCMIFNTIQEWGNDPYYQILLMEIHMNF